MATKKKLLQAAAGVGGAGLNVEEVFSTYLYTGNDTTRSITNGIDLSSEGGLVWIKNRSSTREHSLYDTQRGVEKLIKTNSTGVEQNNTTGLTAFNSDGFSLGTYADINGSAYGDFASWTFRKAPKFFDVVTYTGTGSAQTISHNLGSVPGMIICKKTSNTQDWAVYHRGLNSGTNPEQYYIYLNLTNSESNSFGSNFWNNTAPTDSVFTVNTDGKVNQSGEDYVAYLFAHNDGDGEFGPDADADIIKCGSYTGNGSTSSGPHVDLGFEPQWILVKSATQTSTNWSITDNMRGFHHGNQINLLYPHLSNAEAVVNTTPSQAAPTPTGFQIQSSGSNFNTSGQTYIYIAIRRGPMAVPESATDVFAMDTSTNTNPQYNSGFPVDLAMWTIPSLAEDTFVVDRMRGTKYLITNSTTAEANSAAMSLDWSDGFHDANTATNRFAWMWRRAPSFCDVVAYTGTGSNQTISHNLGVAPKFMIVKERTTTNNWVCYLEVLGNDKRMALNGTNVATDTTAWQSTTPTDSAFYVGANSQTNVSGEDFIAYLFGEVSGISKFGTYTGTGAAQNIDCGFSSGARFVLTKTYAGTNPNADWNIWDSERGIVAGNDPYLALNSSNAEVTSTDAIDPYSSGFSLTSSGVANNSGTSYWFYAIA